MYFQREKISPRYPKYPKVPKNPKYPKIESKEIERPQLVSWLKIKLLFFFFFFFGQLVPLEVGFWKF